jgi:hypothetical protein
MDYKTIKNDLTTLSDYILNLQMKANVKDHHLLAFLDDMQYTTKKLYKDIKKLEVLNKIK